MVATTTKYRTAALKDEIDINGKRICKLEKSDSIQDERIGSLREKVDKHDDAIDTLEKFSIRAGQAISIARWVMIGFGVYIIALLWQLVTGQVILHFP